LFQGAYHSSDVPIVFGTTELKPGASKNTPEQDKYIKNVMTAWATFAKDPEKGLVKLGWPIADATPDSLVRLGYNNKSEISFGPNLGTDTACTGLRYANNPAMAFDDLFQAMDGLLAGLQPPAPTPGTPTLPAAGNAPNGTVPKSQRLRA
jgi:hypothetical protein